ncbi:hypothetical protein [Pseudodesulfovibrio sp.]|uniref:hypothetical protein n=1 Tax=Pseudodesulfovibrio sp. TaxID=2035812 RepID=UPI00260FC6CF|nr:hypothetical protein [Pseudodesulfovibrio sp.]MDD3311957.1 hypothetical protein [Pseudodesulfovibrio sp.]
MSFVIWRLLYEKRGKQYVSGVILGALSGSIVLLLGPIGFYIGLASEKPEPLGLSQIPFILAMSGIAFPVVLLAMHGWAVVLASVFWGGLLETVEKGNKIKVKGET